MARALAATGAHIESAELKAMTPRYRGALETLFGAQWQRADERVREWGNRITSAAALKSGSKR